MGFGKEQLTQDEVVREDGINKEEQTFESEKFKEELDKMRNFIEEKKKELDEMKNLTEDPSISKPDRRILERRIDTIEFGIDGLECFIVQIKRDGDHFRTYMDYINKDSESILKFIEECKSEKE